MKSITVKSGAKARQLIDEFEKKNNFVCGFITSTAIKCECGTTNALTWSNGYELLTIAICDCCGDDDQMI